MALDADSTLLAHAAQNAALILLSLILLPLDTFILFASYAFNYLRPSLQERHRASIRSPHTPIFFPKTVLVTGVGMAKGLCLARLFYMAGHNVIGADFEPSFFLPIASGRVSKSIGKFYKLEKPGAGPEGGAKYTQSILEIVKKEKVDIWVSCSGVASAIEDGIAKEMIELATDCKAVQFDVPTTKRLHEKHSFIEYTKSIGLPTPDTHTITSKAAALKLLDEASDMGGKKYILKFIGTDDAVRGDMTLLPLSTPAATKAHISRLPISEEKPWILQQYIRGPEFCTHALVVKGEVKAFVACPSSELLMHYVALPTESGLSQTMLRFTQEYAAAGGEPFTGHLSFDFLVETDEAEAALRDPAKNVRLHPIECNPRAHTAVVLFNETPQMAEAYMSLLPSSAKSLPQEKRMSKTNGLAPQPIFPIQPKKYFWTANDLVEKVILPFLSLFTAGKAAPGLGEVFESVLSFLEHLIWWQDGTWEVWDPLPAWWLYHVYWPTQFVLALVGGKKWSRLNVSTTKMFMC